MFTVNKTNTLRCLLLVFFLVLLALFVLASIGFGSHALDAATVWDALAQKADPQAERIIWEQRIPRTVIAIMCGAALALAGSLMQSLTRNPLAEPGILGINAGASVTVVLSVVVFGVLNTYAYMLAAIGGAFVTALAVYSLGKGKNTSTVRLALAGVALAAALSALNQALILAHQDAYNEFRFWVAGSLEGRDISVALTIAPFFLLGLVLSAWACPAINALSMGEENAISLGVNLRRTYTLTLCAVTLLAGMSTAAIGPISFVGLAVPYTVRFLLGNDVRWVSLGSLLLGPSWLLLADVLARTLIAPQETQVGIIATLLGAPLFVVLMSRKKAIS